MTDATTPAADGGHDSDRTEPPTDTIPVHPTEHDLDAVEVRTDAHFPEAYAVAVAHRRSSRCRQDEHGREQIMEDGTTVDTAAV